MHDGYLISVILVYYSETLTLICIYVTQQATDTLPVQS